MPINPTGRVYDRVTSFQGGMNAYNYPADLPLNQNQLLSNMIVLDSGRAVTRPGANQIDSNPSTFTNINPMGTVQGLGFLDNFTYGQFIMLVEGGKTYKFNGSQWSTSLSWSPASAEAAVCMTQGIDKMLMSDGVGAMQLYDGNAFVAQGTGPADTSDTDGPTGVTCMTFIAGMYVVAGNLTMGNGNSGTTTYPPDTLMFSNYLLSGQTVMAGVGSGGWNASYSFRVGNGDGEPIIGVVPIQTTASTYPIYNLAVLKSNSVWIVAINPGAYQNDTGSINAATLYGYMFAGLTASAQGDQVGTGIGCVGGKAFCVYQNDLLFMSTYGVQSLQRMQAAAGQYQLTAPLSQPIQPYIDRINWDMAYNIQAIKYKQYAMFFVPLDNSATNNYALVWDGFLGQWMIFTGWTPECAIVTRFANQIALVLGDSAGNVNQWQDSPSFEGLDPTYFDNDVPIPWSFTTRSFTFKDLEAEKKAKAVLIRFNAGNAEIQITAYYDSAPTDSWVQGVTPTGTILGETTILPFQLASSKPVVCWRSELGNVPFNELWLTVGSPQGYADVRNVLAIAYRRDVRDPTI
jgi:hypothetical protein